MCKNKRNTEILHEPFGTENPYKVSRTERDPREPVEGQLVTLNAVSTPLGEVTQMVLELSSEKISEKRVYKVKRMSSKEGGDLWSVDVSGLASGDEYRYRFVGNPASNPVFSSEWRFEMYDKVFIQKILDVNKGPRKLSITYQSTREGFFPQLKLYVEDGKRVTGTWTVLKEPPKKLNSGETAAPGKFTLGKFAFKFSREAPIISIENKNTGFELQEAGPCILICDREGKVQRLIQHFHSPNDEAFYGFGERYNTLNQRGYILDNIVYNQWECQGLRTYFPTPFFLSSNNYGIFIETNRNVEFDMCCSQENEWSYDAVLNGVNFLTFHVWVSRDPGDIISWFTQIVGKPKLPPEWVFGLWMSSNCWNSQERVLDEVNQSLSLQIPASALVIEAWSDETTFFIWNEAKYPLKNPEENFTYFDFKFVESGKWKDPKGLVKYLNSLGISLVLWQVPVIKSLHEHNKHYGPQLQHQLNEEFVIDNKLCLFTKSGLPYRIPDDKWFGKSLVMDFTSKKAIEWWMAKRRYLVEEVGVAGFKTDGGEQVVKGEVIASNQLQGDELRNLYPKQYLKAYSEFLETFREDGGVLFSRSGYCGAQSYSCHWAGDQDSTWDTIKECLYAGLSAGLSGVSFWGWDMGGFSNELPSAELYLRSTAVAAFCPIMQFHSIVTRKMARNNSKKQSYDRTPWNVQKESENELVVPTFRKFVNVRMNLIPYILKEARNSSSTGLPMMRSISVFDSGDEIARDYPFQYYFGSDLLIAPVVDAETKNWDVYLPDGSWYNFWTDEHLEGGRTIAISVPIDYIPVFVREGAILPLNLPDSLHIGGPVGNPFFKYQNLCFKIYPDISEVIELLQEKQRCRLGYDHQQEREELLIRTENFDAPILLIIRGVCNGTIDLDDQRLTQETTGGRIANLEEFCWAVDPVKKTIIVKLIPGDGSRRLVINGFRMV